VFQRILVAIAIALCVIIGIAGCRSLEGPVANAMRIEPPPVEGGDRDEGYQLLMDYGCGACHNIPGIPGAFSYVGPPLDNWSQRQYIAGSYPNNVENLTVWIMNPQGMAPNTAMPILGVTEQEALHMSAYLYSIGN
jgi:cytochrome c